MPPSPANLTPVSIPTLCAVTLANMKLFYHMPNQVIFGNKKNEPNKIARDWTEQLRSHSDLL